MRPWDALTNAMGTSRNRRIGSRAAEQLLGAGPGDSSYPELTDLFAAAAAPPRSDELLDLWMAVAAFERAGQDGELPVPATRRRRILAGLVIKVVAAVAVVSFGGAALAAETGNLPSGAQQHAHDVFSALGVPPPSAAPAPTSPAGHAAPTGSPSTGHPAPTPRPTTGAELGLCRSWQARQRNPKTKPMKAEALHALAAAAGGVEHIAVFCAPLLAGAKGPTATTDPTTVAATPSHPGNGKGHVRTTPTPHQNG